VATLFRRLALALLIGACAFAQSPDPCEGLLAAGSDRPVWPGLVVDVPSGDTLLVQLRDLGRRRIRLAALRAPRDGEPLAAAARFHLGRLAKGLRVFVVLDARPEAGSGDLIAVVEDFAEAQLAAGLGRYLPEEKPLLGAYLACRCEQAEARAKRAGSGLWAPTAAFPP